MRTFRLIRDVDVTGVSGTGVVAEGIEFTDGRCAIRWIVGEHRSTVAWDSITSVHAIHGHGGNTRIVFQNSDGAAAAFPNVPAGSEPRVTVSETYNDGSLAYALVEPTY